MYFFNLYIIYLLFNNKYSSPKWIKICESSNKKIKYPSPRWLEICESSNKKIKYPSSRWLKICESSKKYKNNN